MEQYSHMGRLELEKPLLSVECPRIKISKVLCLDLLKPYFNQLNVTPKNNTWLERLIWKFIMKKLETCLVKMDLLNLT